MFRFVIQKMISKKWMVLALLIGNILLISITGSNAMYNTAVLQRGLTQDLTAYMEESNNNPGLITVNTTSNYADKHETFEAAEVVRGMADAFGVDARETVEYYYLNASHAKADFERKGGMVKQLTLGYMKDIEDHIELVGGKMYSDTPDEEGCVEVIVSEKGLAMMKLTLNETFTMENLVMENGKNIRIKVVGVFRNSAEDDPYWVKEPVALQRECLMSGEIFSALFFTDVNEVSLRSDLHTILDYTQLRGDRAKEYLELSAAYNDHFWKINGQNYRDYFSTTLTAFDKESAKVTMTLWVLQVPIFTLLAAFIFMVSKQMLDMEQNEIAVLKSRGASRAQIILTYLLQSAVLAAISLVLGLPLGVYIMQVLGSANAFMEFVHRTALPVHIDGRVFLFCGLAALLSIAAMVLPVFKHSKVTIVNHKQKKHRKSDAPLWQRIFLDVIVLGAALYALYSYNGQKQELSQQVADGAALEPLLFISSSLFMIGAALFSLRILPIITSLLYRIFKKHWSPAMYAAFLQVIRTRYSQSFIMVFLILTIALGIFNAQAARTINTVEEEEIKYTNGADVALMEIWKDPNGYAQNPYSGTSYQTQDFSRYQTLEGVEAVTKVMRVPGCEVSATGMSLRVKNNDHVELMGIHTKEFGEIAWFKDGLLQSHFYDYLNAMAHNSRALLVSRNFETEHNLKLGEAIHFRLPNGKGGSGTIYGFIDYWPGYSPKTYGGVIGDPFSATENYLIVANLNRLQADWGELPYEVWMKMEDSSQPVYDFAKENYLYFEKFNDTSARIVEMKNDPIFQGTNGILTVGFVVVLILCSVGFLIYWILSIKSRSLQFGIYRAMGLSMREVITMLIGEQIFISGTSLATGVLVGTLTSKLYIPLIQIAYASYDNALPLRLVSETSDMVRLAVIVGVMIIVCMLILSWLISKMKIAQALKLGED